MKEIKCSNSNNTDSKVRVGIHSTKLMFGELRKDGSFNYDGICLSASEHRALFAIQKMLDKTNYEGNVPGVELEKQDSTFNYAGRLPRITFTPVEYLEAYGLKKRKTTRGYMEYSSAERDAAIEALNSLSRRRFKIIYKRERFNKGEEKKIDPIETESELLRIYKGYFGLTSDEDKKLDMGDDIISENKLVIGVEVCPVIVDQIDEYFILLPPHLHTTAKELAGKKKQSHYVTLFVNWITLQIEMQRRNKTSGAEIKIGVEKLAGKLRMYKLIENRQWKKIREILDECFVVGRGMGLIENAIIEGEIVKISLPKKVAVSTYKKRNLYLEKSQPLPIKVAEEI